MPPELGGVTLPEVRFYFLVFSVDDWIPFLVCDRGSLRINQIWQEIDQKHPSKRPKSQAAENVALHLRFGSEQD